MQAYTTPTFIRHTQMFRTHAHARTHTHTHTNIHMHTYIHGHILKAMGLSFKDFLAPFASAAVNAFIINPLSCVLYAVTTLVSVFGRDPQYAQPLVDMCSSE